MGSFGLCVCVLLCLLVVFHKGGDKAKVEIKRHMGSWAEISISSHSSLVPREM